MGHSALDAAGDDDPARRRPPAPSAGRRREETLDIAAPDARARPAVDSRLARAATRLASLGLACVPPTLGVGLFATLYVADADDIWYQYRAVLLYPADLVVALTSVAWLIALVAGGRAPAANAVPLGIGALCVAAALSALTAADGVVALAIAGHLALLALFAAAAGDLIARGRDRPFWNVLCVTVIAQSVLAVWQAATQSTAPAGALFNGWPREFAVADSVAVVAALPGVDRWLRAYGSFPHPNILAMFVALALVLISSRAERSGLVRAAQIAGVVALSLTLSRSAWLALALGTLAWVVTTSGWRGIPRWTLGQMGRHRAITVLVALGVLAAGARVTQLDAFPEANSLGQRSTYDAAAWTLVAQGVPVGAGNILIAEQRQGIAVGEPAHNVFLLALAELGLPGVVAWLVLLATVVITARRQADRRGRGALIAVAVALLPLLLLDHYLWTQPLGRIWLVFPLAIAGSLARRRAAIISAH